MRFVVFVVMLFLPFINGSTVVLAQGVGHPHFGSEFYPTDNYSITESKWDGIDEEDLTIVNNDLDAQSPIFLLKEKDTLLNVFDLYKEDAPYTNINLWLNHQPGIEGIKNVFLVESRFTGCGELLDSHYILETEDGRLLRLPSLETQNDGNELYYWQYRFPNEKFGQRNRIVKGYLDLTQAEELISFQKEKVYLWDGKKLIPDP